MHMPGLLAAATFLVALGALGATTLAAAFPRTTQSEVRAPLGTGFTYQGRVEIDGVPHTGSCGLRFTLWDTAAAGSPVGSQHTTGAQVTNGTFSVVVNPSNQFGAGAFSGDARWLETEARCPNSGTFVSLGRTQLTPVPYATYAMDAQDSERLGGFEADAFTRFSRIVHVPAGVITTDNGDALEAAVAGITDATQAYPVLVLLEAGIYDVDTTIVLPSYVTLAGLDRETSTVRGSVAPIIQLAQGATISNLAVEAASEGPAVRLPDGAATIRSSAIRSAGVAIHVPVPQTFASLDVSRSEVDVYCTAAVACTGIELAGSASLTLEDSVVSVSAFGAATSAVGTTAGSGFITIRDTRMTAGASAAVPATALVTGTNSNLAVTSSTFSALTGSGAAVGINSDATAPSITRSSIEIYTTGTGTGITVSNSLALNFSSVKVTGATRYGVLLFGGSSINTIGHSTIDAGGSGAGSPAVQSNGTTVIRHSSLLAGASSSPLFVQAGTTTTHFAEFRGGGTFSTGTLTCTGSATASTFLATGCP